jgi:hypothetical protein
VLWVLETLEQRLGPKWPAKADRAGALYGIDSMAGSNPSVFENLLLALRIENAWDLAGRGPLVTALINNFDRGQREHCSIQLELAALALAQHWDVGFERVVGSETRRVDVLLSSDSHVVPIEVKIVFPSNRELEANREARSMDSIVADFFIFHGVILEGSFPGILSDIGRSQLREALTPLAKLVQSDHRARTARFPNFAITVRPAGEASGSELSMPMPYFDQAARMAERIEPKHLQATESGARWLRVDVLGNYFPERMYVPFPVAVDEIVEEVRDAAAGMTFDGVALSGTQNTGPRTAETVHHSTGATGLIRQVTPLASRMFVAVPLTEAGREEVSLFEALYNDESGWLDSALQHRELATADSIVSVDDSRKTL